MNRSIAIVLVVIVAWAIILVARSRHHDGTGSSANRTNAPASHQPSKSKSKRQETARRPDGSTVTAAEAAKRLRFFLQSGLSDPPDFTEVDHLAKRLSADDLRELVELAGLADMEGLVPWVRCALYAEWGRRDPEGALAHLPDPEIPNPREGWGPKQAWFSLFRGWSEVDPHAALARIQGEAFTATETDPFAESVDALRSPPGWQFPAYEAIFREIARRDGAAAWDALPAHPQYRFPATEGLFRGIQDPHERRAVVARWGPQWTALASAGSGNAATFARTESLGVAAGSALAEIDLALASEWITELHHAENIHTTGRISRVYAEWAARHPAEALAHIATAEQHEVVSLTRGILRTDLALAHQALSFIEHDQERADVLRASLGTEQSFRDYFPEPNRRTNPFDLPQRYEALSAAINTGGFSPQQEAVLRKELEEAYSGFLDP